ncbi:MAG TPA: hypothetical protein VF322_14205 [Gammaproteobacteria bacterium]
MKHAWSGRLRPPTVIAAAAAAGLARAACGAPAALDDAALDAVTAGNAAAPPGAVAATPTDDGPRPSIVVADGARYALERRREIRLADAAQAGTRALNVVGAAAGDVAGAVNVLAPGIGVPGGALQRNVLDQRVTGGASLGRASLAGANIVRRDSQESRFASGTSSSLVTGRELHARTRTHTVDQFSASVPEFNPLQDLTLEVGTPDLGELTVPRFGFDFVEETDVGDFGIRGSAGSFSLGAPRLVLGTVSLDGDDVVLSSGYVEVPSLDLGEVSLTACIVVCTPDVSADLGSFPGVRVDLPGGDLRLDGANPFKDVQINAGHGIVAAGAGEISVVPGRVTLAATLTLDLPDPSFSFDFTIPAIGEIGPWEVDGPDIDIEIPAVSVSHTFLDEPVGFAYSAAFDGVLCLGVDTMKCADSVHRSAREESSADERIRLASASSFSEGGRTVTGDVEVHAGATLTDAEADLIAMSQASALIDSTSSIALGDAAQRGLRAVNAVNAVDTIVGNTLNVAAIGPTAVPAAGGIGSLGQTNVFVQRATRYGL